MYYQRVKISVAIPCHHPGKSTYGDYCYLNNGALLCEFLKINDLNSGILDIDYHAGDGSHDIKLNFYLSIHADPWMKYPFTIPEYFDNSLSFGPKCSWEEYKKLLITALNKMLNLDVWIIAIGLDTLKSDPEVRESMRSTIEIDDYL